MKAEKDGKFPNLRRIELNNCTLNDYDCNWPDISEVSIETKEKLGKSQIQKLISKVTGCKFLDKDSQGLQQINENIRNEKLTNLSELFMDAREHHDVRLDQFLDDFEPHKTIKLEKLGFRGFIMSAEPLKILSEKLTSIKLLILNMSGISGFTGRLSVLFTHRFPTLNTLILMNCKLNSNDLQSLAQANAQGKLPQLKHLDITGNYEIEILDLFAHSAHWNQLTNFATSDGNVLNVEPEFLTTLEELRLWPDVQSQLPSVRRQWSHLKVIQVTKTEVRCIADGVERGMFPSLTTVRYGEYHGKDRKVLMKLYKANIWVETNYAFFST